jgi:peptidyl-prolyl cis-trans isomerase A (cyclophilin A)
VVEGMDVVDALFSGYGEGPPYGTGPDQGRMTTQGNSYLQQDFPQLDYIRSATIVR